MRLRIISLNKNTCCTVKRRYGKSIIWLWSAIIGTCFSLNIVFAQNPSFNVQGKLLNSRTNESISFLVITANSQSAEYRAISDDKGGFLLENLPAGSYMLSISSIHFQPKDIQLVLNKDTTINITLEPAQRVLDDVYITASESKGLTSSSTIDRKAMEHLQPSSFTDILELLPGGRAIDPKLTAMNQIRLREVEEASAGYDISSLGTAFYIDGSPINTTANMQTTSGFTTTDPHGSRNSTNKGVDMRSIPTDQIESVEIVRGIPSVEYGDLTSGLVKITRKKGNTPYSVRMKADGFSKLMAAGKGFYFPEKNLSLNADIDFLDSQSDPRDNYENFKRLSGSIRTEKLWETNQGEFAWNASIDYGTTIDNQRTDPDNSYALTDSYKSTYNRVALSNHFTYKFANKSVLKSLNLSTNFSYQNDLVDLVRWTQARTATVLINSLEEGAHDARYVTPSYAAELRVDGKPLNAFVKARANFEFRTKQINHQFKVGAETNYSKNYGEGQVYDLDFPLRQDQTARPRAFNSIPAMHNLSFFAEDVMHMYVGDHTVNLSAGLRGMGLLSMDKQYSIANKIHLDPRLNIKWTLPQMEINQQRLSIGFGGGYGIHTKLPTLNHLYPDPIYEDIIQLNFYHNNPEFRKANVMTYITDPTNYDLAAAVNKKWEINSDITFAGNRLAITYFNEKMNSGFRNTSRYRALDYRRYDNTSIDAGNLTEAPETSDFEYEEAREFMVYSINTNGGSLDKEGIEYQFTTKRFTSINTRFTLNGAWFKSTYASSQPSYQAITQNVISDGKVRQYVGVYEEDAGNVRQQFNTNLIVDSYLPKLGLTLSSSVQSFWFTVRQQNFNSGRPTAYMDIQEEWHPYTDAELSHPDLQWLNIPRHESTFRKYRVPIDLQVNLKATKEFKNKVRISMFVNRLFKYAPNYESYGITQYRQDLTAPYFGMELNFTL